MNKAVVMTFSSMKRVLGRATAVFRRSDRAHSVTVTPDTYPSMGRTDSGHGATPTGSQSKMARAEATVVVADVIGSAEEQASTITEAHNGGETYRPAGNGQEKLQGADEKRSASAIAHERISHRRVTSTPIQVTTALKLRELFQQLAYAAVVHGCPNAVNTAVAIDGFQKARVCKMGAVLDPVFVFKGHQFYASQMGPVEKDWISRVGVAQLMTDRVQRRTLHPEDGELVTTQLFPTRECDLVAPELIKLHLNNLVQEEHVTSAYSREMTRLALTPSELLGGPAAMGRSRTSYRPFSSTFSQLPAHASSDRTTALRHLIEAAAYQMNGDIWKGVFYPDAREAVLYYCEAFDLTWRKGVSTPPRLTPYKRDWTVVEERMLMRASILLDLLHRWETGSLTDYGMLKHIRGSYFPVPHQPGLAAGKMMQFMFARLFESGMDYSEAPQIVSLHPFYDDAPLRMQQSTFQGLHEEVQDFIRFEDERMAELEQAKAKMKAALKAEKTKFQRFGDRVRKVFRKGPVLEPFDPFKER